MYSSREDSPLSIGFYHIDGLLLEPAEHVAEDYVDQPLAGLFRCPGNMRCDDAVLSVEQDRALYGLFCNLNKKQGGNQLIHMFYYHTLSALCALVCCLGEGLPPVSGGQVAGFLWLGVFVNAVGYLLWALALQDSSAAAISNFAYGTPAIAMVLSCVFLGEPMYYTSVVGLALILAGFFLQMYLTKRSP